MLLEPMEIGWHVQRVLLLADPVRHEIVREPGDPIRRARLPCYRGVGCFSGPAVGFLEEIMLPSFRFVKGSSLRETNFLLNF